MLKTSDYRISPGQKVSLEKYATKADAGLDKEEAKAHFHKVTVNLQHMQNVLFAEKQRSLLIVLQAMDCGGKDSTIRHVLGPLNPQGVRVWNFKAPSEKELEHDFLWRIHKRTPGAGYIGVFNRSHYEDVLIVRVKELVPEEDWKPRYDSINDFEKLLHEEGTRILKFFLHISKDYQREQLQDRLDQPHKHWKFNLDDLKERKLWPQYQEAYEVCLSRCSTDNAPWYVVPAERKWFRNLLIAEVIQETLVSMQLQFPEQERDLKGVTIPE